MNLFWNIYFLTGSLGLKCRECQGGQCNSFSDNGAEKECGSGSNACLFSEASKLYFVCNKITCILHWSLHFSLDIAGVQQVLRSCGLSPDGQDRCITQEVAGVQVEYCYCTSDNCNQDSQCSCSSSSSSGTIKCRQCGDIESGFKCDSPEDQGKSIECPADGVTCFYHIYHNGDTYRGCNIESGPSTCLRGKISADCRCKGDNCNTQSKAEDCTCGASMLTFSFLTLIPFLIVKAL